MTPEEKNEVNAATVISAVLFAIIAGVAFLTGCPTAKGEVVVISSENCAPCLRMRPSIYELQGAGHDIKRLQTEWDADTIKAYGIRAVPTTIVFRDGKEVTRHVGYLGYRQLEQLCRLGVSTRQGHWEVRPRPIASVCLFGGGVAVGCYQWVWIPGDREGVH